MSARASRRVVYFLGTLSLFVGLSPLTQADVIFSNNLESVTTGSYSGGTAVTDGVTEPSTNGSPFGADAALGNASGNNSQSVSTGIGVNGSVGVAATNLMLRSRSTADMTVVTSYSLYFYFDPANTNLGGFVGAGWGRADNRSEINNASGIDGTSPFNSSQSNRFMVGLSRTNTSNDVALGIGGAFNAFTLLEAEVTGDTVTASVTDNTWYQLTFDLTYNHDPLTPAESAFLVENISVLNWGADGITGGTEILSFAGGSFNETSAGVNFDNDPNGYAVFAGNSGRGTAALDNMSAVAIPEPGVGTLGLFAGLVCLFRRRR